MAGSRLAANVSPMHIVPAVSFSEAEIPEDDIPEEYIPETIAEPEQQPEPVLVPVSDPDASASDRETRRQQKWQRLNVAATHIMNAVLVGGPPSPQMPSPPAIASDGVFASRLSLHVDEHPASPHSPSNGHSPIKFVNFSIHFLCACLFHAVFVLFQFGCRSGRRRSVAPDCVPRRCLGRRQAAQLAVIVALAFAVAADFSDAFASATQPFLQHALVVAAHWFGTTLDSYSD
jgi:hypothetical protein